MPLEVSVVLVSPSNETLTITIGNFHGQSKLEFGVSENNCVVELGTQHSTSPRRWFATNNRSETSTMFANSTTRLHCKDQYSTIKHLQFTVYPCHWTSLRLQCNSSRIFKWHLNRTPTTLQSLLITTRKHYCWTLFTAVRGSFYAKYFLPPPEM